MSSNSNYFGPKLTIEPEALVNYENKNWYFEPKIDGIWVELLVGSPEKGKPHTFTTRANMTPEDTYTKELANISLPLPAGSILCGELEAGTDRATRLARAQGFHSLYLFDIINLGGQNLKDKTFVERRGILSHLYNEINFGTMHKPGRFLQTPLFTNMFKARYEHFIKNGGEGCMLKNGSAIYGSGKNDDIVRCKATITDDFVLMGIGKTDSGDKTGEWGAFKDGKLHYLMRAQPKNMGLLNESNCGKLVAEFKGWGRQSSGTLRHAQFIRIRTDKSPEQCILKD